MRNQSRQDGTYRRASISLNRNNITTYAGHQSTWQDNNPSSSFSFIFPSTSLQAKKVST
jgi:hypothetical protein